MGGALEHPPIIIFTNTYPFGTGETFLATELPYLLALKRPIVLVPLYGSGEKRGVLSSLQVVPPLLSFDPKDKVRLLFYGLFNCAPFFFAFRDFFTQKIWRSRNRVWQFGASFLLIRAILSQNRRFLSLPAICNKQALLYFYWGDKTALILPFIRSRGKVVVRFHGSDLYEEVKGFLPFRGRLFPAIDLACPVSQHGADYLRMRYGDLAPHISVARLGSIDQGLGPVPEVGQTFHLVSCAHVIPLKRLHLIAEAVGRLRRREEIRWTHIGEGPLRDQLDGIADCYGYLTHGEVMEFYKQMPVDLFISTSRSEGIPVSMMEALSFGIPVMATAVGGVPELVSDQNGCLLPEDSDVNQVAQALVEFIHLSRVDRNAKRIAARAGWEERWNAEVNFRAFSAMLP